MDEDFAAADYRLQHRRSGSGGSQYEDAYIGRDSEFLVLHLDPHTDYLFRVCARGEGRTEWSPWSIPQTGYTTLAPHGRWRLGGGLVCFLNFLNCVCVMCDCCRHAEWCPGTEGYILSSRRNIAMRNDSSQSRCPVLYSKAPTYFCGQTLTFKYDEETLIDKSCGHSQHVKVFSFRSACSGSLRPGRWIGGTVWACAWTARKGRSHFRETRRSAFQPTVR